MFAKKAKVENNIHHVIRSLYAKRDAADIVGIAPGIAQAMIDETNWPGQRPIRTLRLEERKRIIKTGAWEPVRSEITFASTPDDSLWLIDGQHRLRACSDLQRLIYTRLNIIDARDMNHVRQLYATFDLPDSSRSDNDVLDASCAAGALGVHKKIARAAFRALTLLRGGLVVSSRLAAERGGKSRTGRMEDLPKWTSEIRAYGEAISKADSWLQTKLLSAGTMAVAMYTLRHDRNNAVDFWSGLAGNDGLRKTDPRARLIADFNSRVATNGAAIQNVQRVAVAWNAFCEGRDLKIIKCIDGAPIRIANTPLAKGVAA